MSEPVDTPAGERPGSPAPKSGEPADSTGAQKSAERSDGAQSNSAGPRRNRRRGSRGGRGRKPAGAQGGTNAAAKEAAGASPDGDPRPDLPDRPGEGRASPDAAARALIPKPKIGDS